MNDSELLQYIRKLIEEKSETLQGRTAWQEHLSRHTTVGAKSIQASEIIRGFSGSWASIYSAFPSDERLEKIDDQRTPPNPSKEFSKIGQSGMAEINFAPYDYNTNRQGLKGTSLIGHPISFEIVGTTVKSSACDWQFIVEDNSATPTQGDTLRIDTESSLLSPTGANPPVASDFSRAYGLDTVNPIPSSGLYILISHTGEKPPIINGTVECGLGDGFVANDNVAPTFDPTKPRQAIKAFAPHSKFEIFRVVDINPDVPGGLLTLDPSKRLKDYFNFDPTKSNIIRAITIITPKATRLVTVPSSGASLGRERAFVVVPPQKSLGSDCMPPLNGQTSGDGSWRQGGFDPNDPTLTGGTNYYNDSNNLPIPRVLGRYTATLERSDQGLVKSANLSRLFGNFSSEITTGQVIHIFKKESDLTTSAKLTTDPFGWYEIISNEGEYLTIKKVVEINPISGTKNYQPILVTDSVDIRVHFHLHDPISVLHTNHFDIDAVEHARLDNLIDPTWVSESGKSQEIGMDTLYSKADKAIFNTQSASNGASGTNANPGSLLDLGFRMVLFPAKEIGGELVADFDNPITSRECILDSTIEDKEQYIHIDYSNGLVLLSHAPKWKETTFVGRTTTTTYIDNDINPNFVEDSFGRIVLFASCVPYSRELGQLGSAVRVTASTVDTANDHEEQSDIYGARVSFDLQGSQSVSSQTYNSQLLLTALDSENTLPESGFIEILHSADTVGLSNQPAFTVLDTSGITRRVSTFIYHSKTTVNVGGTDYTALNGVYGGGAVGDSITVSTDGEYKIVLRRNVRALCDDTGVCGVSFQEDTTFGSAKRFDTLRFKNSQIVQNKDGSVTIEIGSGTEEEIIVEEELMPLTGEFVLLPKGATSGNGSGESRFFGGSQTEINNLGDYPNDTPLYEFSGGFGRGYLHKGYPIKPSAFFNFSATRVFTPPSDTPYILDQLDLTGSTLLSIDIPINSGVNSGNLSVGYRHINSRESHLYSSQLRQKTINQTPHETYYQTSMERQMRLLDGMVIEDVTNGTFYSVGSKGLISSFGLTTQTELTLDNSVTISDGDTVYISSSATNKVVEFVFRNVANPSIEEEVLLGPDVYQSIYNLVLVANNHSQSAVEGFSFDVEKYKDQVVLHIYYNELVQSIGPTVAVGFTNVYNHPTDFTGYYGVGGSIVGNGTGSGVTPLTQRDNGVRSTYTDTDLKMNFITSPYTPNFLISSGDRASLFWTFYDPTKTANLNIKDDLFIGYLDLDDTTTYVIPVNFTTGADLKSSLENVCLAINSLATSDYTTVGFPNQSPFYGAEARVCHIEENSGFNRYAIEIRFERVGNFGNRWFVAQRSNLGNTDGIVSVVSDTFYQSDLLNTSSVFWTTYASVGGGGYNVHTLANPLPVGSSTVWFFTGGQECEINYDTNDHFDTTRLPSLSGFGDRTDGDKARKPLAGHHYRVVPNVEFVPVLGFKGVNGGLLPPYTDQADPNTLIESAHALFYDTEYDFQGSDVGSKFYLSGTDTYAYVGWWEILGILPSFTIPQNVENTEPRVVAIVKKIGVESRDNTKDLSMYNLPIQTDRGQLPLTYRAPVVRMGFDTATNGQGGFRDNHEHYGFFQYWDKSSPSDTTYSDLALTIQLAINGVADKVQQFVIPKNDLATGTRFGQSPNPNYIVDSAKELAEFCNADPRTNGSQVVFSDGSTGLPFIYWVVETDDNYEKGCALYATYYLTALNQTQKDSVVGKDGILQINFLSRQDGIFFKGNPSAYGAEIGINDPTAIGFISYPGHNSEFDTCLGDRNSAFVIHPFEMNETTMPSADTSRRSASASNGLRWVISEPLTDRYNGSYVHITKESDYIFTGFGWHNQQAIQVPGSEYPVLSYQDTYRINKCPSTQQYMLGGDVEVFHTELNGVMNSAYSETEPLYRHPIAYSSLSIMGTWNDTETGALPNTGSRNYSPTYKLQVVNKERIVTISPTSMSSNSLFGSQVSTEETGTGGLGSRIINLSVPQMTLGAETPFKLFSKSNIQRSNIWGVEPSGASYGNPDDTRSERELWNSDNIYGFDLMRNLREIPFFYYSLYSWSPNNTWWQVQMPNIQENDQIDASTPPPTLRVDLTEQFTQSLENGGTTAKGVRLNKLWVNFGVWGDWVETIDGNKSAIPGFPLDIFGALLAKPDTGRSEMTKRNHIAFNLVVELPTNQKNRFNKEKRRGLITVENTVAPIDLGKTLVTIQKGTFTANLVAVSSNTATGGAVTLNDYDVIVGNYVDSGGGLWVWTPFSEYQIARALSDVFNLIYKNSDLTPSAEEIEIYAQALYNKVYFDTDIDTIVTPNVATGALQTYLYNPKSSATLTSSGNNTLLFGDRSSTATANHLLNVDTVDPIKTIVVPLYVNRESGDLMPNTMEQQVDIGVGRYNNKGVNVASDWNNGDPTYGFGYSDFPNYIAVNNLATADTVTKSPYCLPSTHTYPFSKYSLVGNPITPMVWGGIDFDSANNNYIQRNNQAYDLNLVTSAISVVNDLHNGWNGDFTAPFSFTANALVQGSQHPRLSRLSGGLRNEYSDGSIVNGDILSRTASVYPFEGPASLSASAMTGIVVTHKATYPTPSLSEEGRGLIVSPSIYGTNNVRARNARSSNHSFTIALTPMGQKFNSPKDTTGRRSSVGTYFGTRTNPLISERLSDFGRYLDPTNEQNLVGNWLGEILEWVGAEDTDGSSLPQGARVYLEVSTNLGGISGSLSNNGVWVGSVKCSFDVETEYGTTKNKLIKDEE